MKRKCFIQYFIKYNFVFDGQTKTKAEFGTK